jgi:hypothetical protein
MSSDQLNERFTVYCAGDGTPVQRTLREMSAGDALLAIKWHTAEAGRLEREAAPATAFMKAYDATGKIPNGTTREQAQGYVALLRKAAAARQQEARLMSLAMSIIPAWQQQDPELEFREALRRHWPSP